VIDYAKYQTKAKALLQKFGAVPLGVVLLNGTTIPTIGIFANGIAKDIDNMQNPTSITGMTGRFAIVPGIDFFGCITPGQTTTPQVSGYVTYYINSVLYKKLIVSVTQETPIPNVPILFSLGIE
jgi:hypothetical protein